MEMQYKMHKVYLQIKLFIRVIIELPLVTRVSQSWSTPAVMVENKGQNDDTLISVRESKQMVRSDNYLPLQYVIDKISDSFFFRCTANNGDRPISIL